MILHEFLCHKVHSKMLNVIMQIFDKLCQSFGSDVLQVLLNSAENVATCSHHVLPSEVLRLILDQRIAVFSSDILTVDGI